MIKHILSIIGCLIGMIICILAYFFGVRDTGWLALMAVGFLVLTLLIYWNLRIELKGGVR